MTLVRKHRVILSACAEEFWQDLVTTRQCLRCGTENLYHDLDGSSSPVLACAKCGERYYKNYPKRTSQYELCVNCGVFFRKAHKDDCLCPNCQPKVEEARTKRKHKKKDNYTNLF
jgi:predicted  nucleic acid-binding Zn-ribbon protein